MQDLLFTRDSVYQDFRYTDGCDSYWGMLYPDTLGNNTETSLLGPLNHIQYSYAENRMILDVAFPLKTVTSLVGYRESISYSLSWHILATSCYKDYKKEPFLSSLLFRTFSTAKSCLKGQPP